MYDKNDVFPAREGGRRSFPYSVQALTVITSGTASIKNLLISLLAEKS